MLQENLNIFIPPIEVLNIDNNLPLPISSSEDDNSDSDDHSIEHDDLNFEDLAEQFEIDKINMENLARLQHIRPLRFDSRKCDVRKFFNKYEKYRETHEHARNHPWDD